MSPAPRKTKKKNGGLISTVIIFILGISAYVGVYKMAEGHEGGFWGWLNEKSDQMAEGIPNLIDNIFGNNNDDDDTSTTPTTNPDTPPTKTLTTLNNIPTTTTLNNTYDRGQWKHWTNLKPCWNVRQEVLYRDATPGTQKLEDKNGNPVTKKKDACRVTSAEWIDPYTGQKITSPNNIDIDHLIPLQYAHANGGHAWNLTRKEQFANSLNDRQLIAVSASANRSKGAKGPAAWMPPNKKYACTYATDWVNTASTWKLTLTKEDKQHLKKTLEKC